VKASEVRVVHVTTGLEIGGAEVMLVKVLKELEASNIRAIVCSLLGEGALSERARHYADDVINVQPAALMRNPARLMKVSRQLARFQPHIIQGWMYHGNLVATVMHKTLARHSRLFWNLRCSEPTPGSRSAEWVRRMGIRYSQLPERIVVNSESGLAYHKAVGYKANDYRVIGNGIDATTFAPDGQARSACRQRLGLPDEAFVIGISARYREMKDYATFFQAVERFGKQVADAYVLVCGSGVDATVPELTDYNRQQLESERLHLLGELEDMPGFMNALDVFTLSSKTGEGFPNVIAEAMACAKPCVVTDSGDSQRIVGECGMTVSPQDPQALANAWQRLYAMSPDVRADIGTRARQRAVNEYDIASVGAAYRELYTSVP